MESYEIIIAVICSVVLCGLVILICACQKKEEKTPIKKTPITAQQMKNLAIQKQKESQEKQLQKDIANSQMILSYLPVLIHNTAKKGWSWLRLSFRREAGDYIPYIEFGVFWDIPELKNVWGIPKLENVPVSSQYIDTLIAKIEKFYKQNGFNIKLKNIKVPRYDNYDIEISW